MKFSGDVVERYVYDPYGQVTFYQANWQKTQIGNETPGTLSAYSNAILFGGYYRDAETGLYNVRNRYYHVQLGWLTRDPLGYAGGVNLYEYCGSGPAGATDAMGLRPMGPGDAGYQPGYENLPWKDVDDNPAPRTAKKKPPKGGGEPGGGGKGVGGKPGGVGGGGAGGGGGGGGGDAKEWYNKWWDWENQEGYAAGDWENAAKTFGDTCREFRQHELQPEIDALNQAKHFGASDPRIDARLQQIQQEIDAAGAYGGSAIERTKQTAEYTLAGSVAVAGGAAAVELGAIPAVVGAVSEGLTAVSAAGAGIAKTAAAIHFTIESAVPGTTAAVMAMLSTLSTPEPWSPASVPEAIGTTIGFIVNYGQPITDPIVDFVSGGKK